MRTRLLIATAAASAFLLGGAALAQSAANSSDSVPSSAATGEAVTNNGQPSGQAGSGDVTAPTASAAPSSDSTTVSPAAGAPAERASTDSAGVEVISNGPIPDTKANRAKYGQPLSNGGRMTKPAGN